VLKLRAESGTIALLSYAVTIFLSAFLLFQIQPLMGRFILPWFGGGPAVWTTCMLFFQLLLLAGYLYAHLVTRHLAQQRQILLHIALIAAAVLLLPIIPSDRLKPAGADAPVMQILLILGLSAGLPYFLLSTTGPLLQSWFRLVFPATSPYRLYALSNAGSLLALLTYPFLVEPALSLRNQALLWGAGLGLFGLLCIRCAFQTRAAGRRPGSESAEAETQDDSNRPQRPTVAAALLWLLLSACGSVLLLAITNQICADIAVVPFLWVLPLTLYLLTFILCFENERLYYRMVFWPLLIVACGGILMMLHEGVDLSIQVQILGFSAGLFTCCMVCHGELVRLKPAPRHLTLFYLMVAAGGALGGVFATLVAPAIFSGFLELHAGLWACCALTATVFWYERRSTPHRLRARQGLSYLLLCLVVLGVFGELLFYNARQILEDSVSISRNFYGVLRVAAHDSETPMQTYYALQHGRIDHGGQFAAPERRRRPTTYYGEESGVGLALLNTARSSGLRVGIVGLGAGTLAAYGRPGDWFTFYEINPAVRDIATRRFTYLSDSPAKCDIALGDARMSLERQAPQNFDVLVLDAFSSDAIPVHLLTREAFETYLKHLKKEGVLAVHISNRYLDFSPVIRTLASHFRLGAVLIESESDPEAEIDEATWMLLTRNTAFLGLADIQHAAAEPPTTVHPILWTDDHSNLFQILK